MIQILTCLLTLLFSISSPALGENGDFGRSPVAAEGTLYRGGDSLAARLGTDVKADADGLINAVEKSGKPQGISLNIDPKDAFIQKYGGAFPVKSLPDGLQALPSGRAGHFVIAPTSPMTFENYQQLLNQVELGTSNAIR